jgi:hypothetical protein
VLYIYNEISTTKRYGLNGIHRNESVGFSFTKNIIYLTRMTAKDYNHYVECITYLPMW